MRLQIALALALALAPLESEAATVAITAGSGTTFLTAQDGSGNNISLSEICGGLSATLPTTPTSCVEVDGSGNLHVAPFYTSGSIASGAVASGAYASGSIASGAVASGAYAAGAFASGAAVSGSWADGSIVTIGTEADAAWTTGSGTVISVLKGIDRDIQGNADPCNSAVRTLNLPVAFSSATTTKIATGNTGQNLYVCEIIGVPNGANNITLISGNGSNCATNQVIVGGPWYLGNVGNGIDLGKGITSMAVTQTTGYDICITTSTTAAISVQAVTVLK